ncbi:hypothetical protein PPYR_04885 [Photinus pyralis]|uniref:Uncharacterized protein n=3 Tax=Photinus pyralis TaxID=7054 RepID=A0A5N4AZD2_PHOPY|nr:hypothetical protein PPYR_04885 [Photinus pyralis]
MASLKVSKLKRDSVVRRVNEFAVWLNDNENVSAFEIKSRLDKIDPLYDEFYEVHLHIESLDRNDYSELKRDFETNYFAAVASARERMAVIASSGDASVSNASSTENKTSLVKENVRLPVIQLPTFDGKYEDWYHFKETFVALIESNSAISQIQKYYYLNTCLKGPAAEVLKSLEISQRNYPIAWKLLEERFENEKLVVNHHVQALFDMPSLIKDNFSSLRRLIDDFNKHIGALQQLKQPVSTWDTILIYMVVNKLDTNLRKAWEDSLESNDLPKLSDLMQFLVNKCRVLETIQGSKGDKFAEKTDKGVRSKVVMNVASDRSEARNDCLICNDSHFIYKCPELVKLTVENRINKIRELRLCLNCLKRGHAARFCKASRCRICKRAHNSVLHLHRASTETDVIQDSSTAGNDIEERLNAHCNTRNAHVFLTTAIVKVRNSQGKNIPLRALLDSGSDSNFIGKGVYRMLGLKQQRTNVSVSGIGHVVSNIHNQAQVTIGSMYNDFSRTLKFLIINEITATIPSVRFDKINFQIPADINLADVDFNVPGRVDILIGAEVFYDILLSRKLELGKNKPILRESQLGWLVTGKITHEDFVQKRNCNTCVRDVKLLGQLQKFWEVENFEIPREYASENEECEVNFINTSSRDVDGRFIVQLPLKGCELGESGATALKRFLSLERRLARDVVLKNNYSDFMTEYHNLGHMELVKSIDHRSDIDEGELIYYIPHHAIVKEGSSTTKLRVVFDASAQTTNGKSLNDILRVGPVIQNDLLSIMMRFRKHNVVLVGDIEKMYRQVWVQRDFQNLQRIIWRDEDKLNLYRLKTVTYGTAPASFLATRCLRQLANENKIKYEHACRVITDDFYIDDLITGGEDVAEVVALRLQITSILRQGGFNLRKFGSNEISVLESIQGVGDKHVIKDDKDTKTLGIIWESKADIIKFEIDNEELDTLTKRNILRAISKIFDPLGLVSPVVISAKILIQGLWALQLGWDEEISENVGEIWTKFWGELQKVRALKIPRHVVLERFDYVELHGFCDASEKAYGCAVYVRSVYGSEVRVALLCAKSRVAPTKRITLPRLELCGAVLLVQLVETVKKNIKLAFAREHYWTDSNIVLCWVNKPANSWKTFVSNRVGKIQELTEASQWSHVSGILNPADLVTRGVSVETLQQNRWFEGPEFLESIEITYSSKVKNETSETLEMRSSSTVFTAVVNISYELFERFSTLTKLIRVLAWCRRFFKNCAKIKTKGVLTCRELAEAGLVVVKAVQGEAFQAELKNMKVGNASAAGRLLKLNPFLDDNNVIRVGGRLKNSQLSYNSKHPIVLPKNHKYVELLIKQEHARLLHAGAQAVLATIRTRYWILGGRDVVRRVLRKCIICFRTKPLNYSPLMGDLPAMRSNAVRPFYTSSVDYGGPFLINDSKLRNRKFIKCYLCVFVCGVSKAVHLELATDLTASTFLLVLKRFIARRGIPKELYSDNGTNFVGAYNQLKNIRHELALLTKNEELQNFITKNNIEWHFMPANSPHMGGLHEAAVKSAKCLLYKLINNVHFTYEDFYTLLCQIEGVLNSRPLTTMSTDPNDYSVLTPGHFLIGEALVTIPEKEVTQRAFNSLKSYEKICRIRQQFWERWNLEYLTSLQERSKWRSSKGVQPKVGDPVLLMEEHRPPQMWTLGRITHLHPGSDGIVRVVSVKTPNSEVTRAVRKVCPLPLDVEQPFQGGEDVESDPGNQRRSLLRRSKNE